MVIDTDTLHGEPISLSLDPRCSDTVKYQGVFQVVNYERYKLEIAPIKDSDGQGKCELYDEKYIGFIKLNTSEPKIPINLAGAVSSELEVDVRINDTTVKSKCGVFYLMGREDGTYRVSYNSRFAAPRSITVTKDKGFYHIYPITRYLDKSIPPIKPHGLRVDSVFIESIGFINVIHVYLGWERNGDCDTKGYKIYRALDWGGDSLIYYAIDSTDRTTYHDEILVVPPDPFFSTYILFYNCL
ncbi:MAG: hypothetical protein GXO39_04880 [Thermotogae bacterium]|nr:hypothetical protein [Thermotogota bacterium]